jgi:hypothetical protein
MSEKGGVAITSIILILLFEVTSSEIPYRCVADLPGQNNVRTEFIFPPITGIYFTGGIC